MEPSSPNKLVYPSDLLAVMHGGWSPWPREPPPEEHRYVVGKRMLEARPSDEPGVSIDGALDV